MTAKTPQEIMAKVAPQFSGFTKDILWGTIWELPGLSKREKCLITIATILALARVEQLEIYFELGLQSGLTKDEIVSAITHVAFYAGWPTAVSGLVHLNSVLEGLDPA